MDRGLPALQANDKRLIVSFNHAIMPFSLLSAALLTCTAPFLFSCFYLLLTSLSLTHFPVLDLYRPDSSVTSSSLCQPSQNLFCHVSCSFPTFLTHLLIPHLCYSPFFSFLFFLLFFLLRSSLPFLSLRCRMPWAMSCHGSILSLLSSSALFSFSISFWECWAGKRLCCCHLCMCSRCAVWLYLLF